MKSKQGLTRQDGRKVIQLRGSSKCKVPVVGRCTTACIKRKRVGGAGAGSGVRENTEPDGGRDRAGAVRLELH